MSSASNPGQGDNPPLAPINDPGYNDWWNAMNAYNTDYNNYIGDLAQLKADLVQLAHMKGNAGEKLMFCIYTIFPGMQKPKEDNIKVLADTQNVDTGLREMMNEAQRIWVGSKTTPPTPAQAQQLYQDITDLQYAVNNSINTKTRQSIIGSAELAQLQSSITDIQTQFGSHWGDYQEMANDMEKWWASGGTPPPTIAQFNQYIAALLLENQNNWGDPNLAILLPEVQKDPSAANLAALAKYLSTHYPNDPNVIGLKAMFGADWGKGTAMETDLVGWQQAGNGKMPQNVAAFDAYLQNLLKDDPNIWGLILAFGMAPPGPKQAAVLAAIAEYLAQHDPNDPNTLGLEKLFGKAWGGDGTNMEADYNLWVNGNGNTPPPPPGPPVIAPQVTALNTDFQTIMETVSTLGAALNAKLSYYTNDYNQNLGIYKNVYKDENAQDTTMVRNQRPN